MMFKPVSSVVIWEKCHGFYVKIHVMVIEIFGKSAMEFMSLQTCYGHFFLVVGSIMDFLS